MVDTELANLSNQLMLGTVLMYLVAMFGYAADLAFGHRRKTSEQAKVEQRVLVGAGGVRTSHCESDISWYLGARNKARTCKSVVPVFCR